MGHPEKHLFFSFSWTCPSLGKASPASQALPINQQSRIQPRRQRTIRECAQSVTQTWTRHPLGITRCPPQQSTTCTASASAAGRARSSPRRRALRGTPSCPSHPLRARGLYRGGLASHAERGVARHCDMLFTSATLQPPTCSAPGPGFPRNSRWAWGQAAAAWGQRGSSPM